MKLYFYRVAHSVQDWSPKGPCIYKILYLHVYKFITSIYLFTLAITRSLLKKIKEILHLIKRPLHSKQIERRCSKSFDFTG